MKKTTRIISALAVAILVLTAYMYIKNTNEIRTDTENFLAKTFHPAAYAEVSEATKTLNSNLLDFYNYKYKSAQASNRGLNIVFTYNYRYKLSDYEKDYLKEITEHFPAIAYEDLLLLREAAPHANSVIYEYRDISGYVHSVKSSKKMYEKNATVVSEYIAPRKHVIGTNFDCSVDGTRVICTYKHNTTDMSESDIASLIGSEDDNKAVAYERLADMKIDCPEIGSCTILHTDLNGKELYSVTADGHSEDDIVRGYCNSRNEKAFENVDLTPLTTVNLISYSYGTDVLYYICFPDVERANDGRVEASIHKLGLEDEDAFLDILNSELKQIRSDCPQVYSLRCSLCDKNENTFKTYYVGEKENYGLIKYCYTFYENDEDCIAEAEARGNTIVEKYNYKNVDDTNNENYEQYYQHVYSLENDYADEIKELRELFPELKGISVEHYDKNGKLIVDYEYN